MARVVALMDDLFFQMKVAETAKQLGMELKVAGTPDSLMQLVEMEPVPLLAIVDLNARGGAIAAGCDEVMPRSSFTQNLAAILASAKE